MATVLIVDDDVLLARATARLLEKKGHETHTANTGEEGLRALVAERVPECVILDVEMPRLTGPQMAYEMVRHDGGWEDIPIVLVSGRGDLAEIAARVRTPYYLSKGAPDYMRELYALLGRALDERIAPGPAR